MKNNLCIIQARMGSTRLPGKVLKIVNGISLLEYEINRIKLSKKIDKIVVATGNNIKNNKIVSLCKNIKVDVFRGAENDVLDRYYKCSLKYPEYKNVIRITGDCPLIDPVVIDEVIEFFENNKFDYVSNTLKETFPDGMDVEVMKVGVLHKSAKLAKLPSMREHLTQYIIKSEKFKKGNFPAKQNWSHFRLTVDNEEDFEVVKFLIKNSFNNSRYLDYISLLTSNIDVMLKNMHIKRNEGLLKSLREDNKKQINI